MCQRLEIHFGKEGGLSVFTDCRVAGSVALLLPLTFGRTDTVCSLWVARFSSSTSLNDQSIFSKGLSQSLVAQCPDNLPHGIVCSVLNGIEIDFQFL